MTRYCYNCGKECEDTSTYCSQCGSPCNPPPTPQFKRTYYESSATSISGAVYDVPSPVYISPEFTTLAKKYDENIEVGIAEETLIKDIPKNTLIDYIQKGYLRKIGNKYLLTDSGKDYYQRNMEFRDKIRENRKKIKLFSRGK